METQILSGIPQLCQEKGIEPPLEPEQIPPQILNLDKDFNKEELTF